MLGLGCTMRAAAARRGVDLIDFRLSGNFVAFDMGGSGLCYY
jgi:hypothetical protein